MKRAKILNESALVRICLLGFCSTPALTGRQGCLNVTLLINLPGILITNLQACLIQHEHLSVHGSPTNNDLLTLPEKPAVFPQKNSKDKPSHTSTRGSNTHRSHRTPRRPYLLNSRRGTRPSQRRPLYIHSPLMFINVFGERATCWSRPFAGVVSLHAG